MSNRILGFVVLLVAYAAISLYLSDERLQIVLYGVPLALSSLVAAAPKWNSPYANVLTGVCSFVLVCLPGVDTWGLTTLVLSAVQLAIVALYALSLVSGRTVPDADPVQDSSAGRLVPPDQARTIIARELRRSRRTRSPLSLLMFDGMGEMEPEERHELIEFLTGHAREFDTVFSVSPNELGILCVDTDRAGARQYADRLQTISRVRDISIACFPDDAVTSQGLFDIIAGAPSKGTRAERAVIAE